jgi:hypothetical protein
MSPARIARRKESRLTFLGMAIEIAYTVALAAFCCLCCALAYVLAR